MDGKKTYWMKVFFSQRPFATPLPWRVLEGLTTFSMPLGFLLGGGEPASLLFLFYLLHSLASFVFHLSPSAPAFLLDTSLIDLLCMERRQMVSHHPWVYTLFLVATFVEDTKTMGGVVLRVGLAIASTWVWTGSMHYLGMVLVMFSAFLLSCHCVQEKHVVGTTLACCLFHLSLGCVSYIETGYYDWGHQPQMVEKLFRHCVYLVFAFYTATYLTSHKRHLNCVLTFLTSLVLTPLSWYEIWHQIQTPTLPYTDTLQEDILLFYLAFCVVDMVIGRAHYPEYFRWLEGVFHHVATMAFACYFLWSDKKINFCIGLVEETSSIFLNLSRLFPHIPMFNTVFFWLFVLFRVVTPLLLVWHLPDILTDPASITLFSGMMVLNLYWLSRQMRKRK